MADRESEWLAKWESQLKKGMLDLIILLSLKRRDLYGYEMIRSIRDAADLNIAEGTIYPILNRLRQHGLVASRWVEKESGMPRKYYRITERGELMLGGMRVAWRRFSESMEQVWGGGQ